jgi:uncharacterized protein
MDGGVLFAGLVTGLIGYAAIAAVAAQRLLRAQRRTPASTPADIGFAYKDIHFKARGERLMLAAWHISAPGATRAVIIAHGVGGCRGHEFTSGSLALVEYLVSSGFSVLLLDLRGHGASDAARMTYGVRERRDVLGAVDWLLAHGYDPGQIGVLGASMGGVAAIGAAGEEPAIGALVIDSACADFGDMMRLHFRRLSKLPVYFLPGALLIGWALSGENLARLRPAELLRAISRRPVLIIHAKRDRVVPLSHAHALAAAGEATLWITRSPHHLGSFTADPQAYCQRVVQFFQHALASKTTSRSADAPPMTVRVQGRLEMRWYTGLDGRYLCWEVPSPVATDADQRADEPHDTPDVHDCAARS